MYLYATHIEGGFVTRDQPFFFSVKCEMAIFFLVNRDFHSSREAWFCKLFSVKRDLDPLYHPHISCLMAIYNSIVNRQFELDLNSDLQEA